MNRKSSLCFFVNIGRALLSTPLVPPARIGGATCSCAAMKCRTNGEQPYMFLLRSARNKMMLHLTYRSARSSVTDVRGIRRKIVLSDDDFDRVGGDHMEFRLTYAGPLYATQREARPGQPSRHRENKRKIRSVFHKQL